MFQYIYSKEDQLLIEKAVTFLVDNFNRSGNNSKPVILHSLRVGMRLYEYGEKTTLIIGALLHDLIEDTKVTSIDISKSFGEEVAQLVEANTFNDQISDYAERYVNSFERSIAYSRDAALIRALDILDNSDYYALGSPNTFVNLYSKYRKFVEMSHDLLSESFIWKELIDKQEILKIQLGIK